MTEQYDRLRQAREAAGYLSAEAAAVAMSVKPATYRHHENGTNGLSRSGRKYANFFRVRYDWLMNGSGPMREEKFESIRIEGVVGAGAAVDWELDATADGQVVRAPNATTAVGFVVHGDSQYPRFMSGEVILTARQATSPAELIGRYAIVQTADGRRLIKILRRNPNGGDLFRLESHNAAPEDDVHVIGAWRFLGVLPAAEGDAAPKPIGRRK